MNDIDRGLRRLGTTSCIGLPEVVIGGSANPVPANPVPADPAATDPAATDPVASGPVGDRPDSRPRVLIAEDSYLIAVLLEQILEDQGWEVIGPAARVSTALALADSERIDAALLDINLCGEMCWDLATVLQERGIPFAFTTGYGSSVVLPEHLAGVFVLEKPFRTTDVENRLRAMLHGHAHR